MTTEAAGQTGERRPGGESPIWSFVLLNGTFLLILLGVVLVPNGAGRDVYKALLGVIATLGIFSILYQENPFFRFMEHIFIGLAAGYGLVATWFYLLVPKWWEVMHPHIKDMGIHPFTFPSYVPDGHWWYIFALLLGLLFFTVYFPKLAWMNRLLIFVLMGWTAGNAFQMFVGALAPQIVAAFKAPVTAYFVNKPAPPLAANQIPVGIAPLLIMSVVVIVPVVLLLYGARMWAREVYPKASDFLEALTGMAYIAIAVFLLSLVVILVVVHPTHLLYLHLWWLIEFVVLVCVLAYFFYSVQHKHIWIRVPANAGRYLLMISLGAIFGTTVMSRFTLLIGVLLFLIETFMGWWSMFMHALHLG